MSREKDIEKAIKRFEKNRFKFEDMAKYLEGRLKERESLFIGLELNEAVNLDNADFLKFYLEIRNTIGKPERVITIDYFGYMTHNADFFKDYKLSSDFIKTQSFLNQNKELF